MAVVLLLKLPPEILDMILEYVICSRKAAPDASEDASKIRNAEKARETRCGCMIVPGIAKGRSRLCYKVPGTADTSSSLLLVSKKIHHRTKATLARLFPQGSDFLLDVLYMNEACLWPTWLHVPKQSNHVNSVEIMLRVNDCGEPSLSRGIQSQEWGHLSHTWLSLLNSIFHDDTGPPEQSDLPRMTVRNINIKVTCANLDFVVDRESRNRRYRRLSPQTRLSRARKEIEIHEYLHSGTLAWNLARQVLDMINVSNHDAGYSMLMLERVKDVQVTHIDPNGSEKVWANIDLGWTLREMWHHVEGADIGADHPILKELPQDWRILCYRVLCFWNWKLRALRARQLYFDDPDPRTAHWPPLALWKLWKIQLAECRQNPETRDEQLTMTCDQHTSLCTDESVTHFLQDLEDNPLPPHPPPQDLQGQQST